MNLTNIDNKIRKEDKWNSLFDLLNREEISKLENEINLAVKCEQDEKGNIITLFLADYGVKKEMKFLAKEGENIIKPNCTLFLNYSYFEELKKKNSLNQLKEHCEALAEKFKDSKRMDLEIVDFHPEKNILDNYLKEHYFNPSLFPIEGSLSGAGSTEINDKDFVPNLNLSKTPNGDKDSTGAGFTKGRPNVSLYCLSSPRDPAICFGRDNVKKKEFKTEFQYSIFDLAPFDTRPNYEIFSEKAIITFLEKKKEFESYKRGIEFFNNMGAVQDKRKEQNSPTQSRKAPIKIEKLFLKDFVGFLEWNWIETSVLFIIFGEKLVSTNRLLQNSLSFEEELQFKYDLPPTADKMVEEIFSRYLKKHIEEKSQFPVSLQKENDPFAARFSLNGEGKPIKRGHDNETNILSNKEIFYFLMLKLGKLKTGLNQKDKEIVDNFLVDKPVKSPDLINNYKTYGISHEGIKAVKKAFPLSEPQKTVDSKNSKKTSKQDTNNDDKKIPKLLNPEAIRNIKNLGEEDFKKLLYLFHIVKLDDFDKQKEYFDGLCGLNDGAIQFNALKCNSLKYFASLDPQTTAYLNGFPMSGFKSDLAHRVPELKDCDQSLREYSFFLEKVNHFVPFQFFSTSLHLSFKPAPASTSHTGFTSTNPIGSTTLRKKVRTPFAGSTIVGGHAAEKELRQNRHSQKNFQTMVLQKSNFALSCAAQPQSREATIEDQIITRPPTVYTTINLKNSLQNLVYPIGLPRVYATTANQKGLTLKKFLDRYKGEFYENLWKIIVSGTLSFKQDLLLNAPLEERKEKREEFYQPSQIEGGQSMYDSKDLSNLTRLSNSPKKKKANQAEELQIIQNAVITKDLLDNLQNICSKNEMGEIYNFDVETAVFWKKEDCVEDLQEWYNQAINDQGSFSYQEKDSLLSDSRTNKWYPIKLSENFINPLIEEAYNLEEKEKRKGRPAVGFDASLLAEAIYRVFTSSELICGNAVLADVITAKARLFMWQISKSFTTPYAYRNPITCGKGYSVKSIIRKPSLEKLFYPDSIKNHRNVNESFADNLASNLKIAWRQLNADHKPVMNAELVEEWAKVIKTYYPKLSDKKKSEPSDKRLEFSDDDLSELKGIIKGEGTIYDKINLLANIYSVRLFWVPYKLSHPVPVPITL